MKIKSTNYPGYNYISTYLKDIGENVQMNRVKTICRCQSAQTVATGCLL